MLVRRAVPAGIAALLAASVLGPLPGASAAADEPEPRAIVVGMPDAMIGLPPGSFGNDVYSADGSGQVKRVRIKAGHRKRLTLGFENDGPSSESFTISSCEGGGKFTIVYLGADLAAGEGGFGGGAGAGGTYGMKIRVANSADRGLTRNCHYLVDADSGPAVDDLLIKIVAR